MVKNFDKASAKLSSSQKYGSTVTNKAMEPLVFMYHDAMSIYSFAV